jgi:glycerol-3-phosphate dehydrogenase
MKQYIGNIEIGNLFQRADLIAKASQREEWDVIVIGGGSTGLGVALDAVSRGFTVLLLEQSDFAKGTSSKSTKLVHGGVRYLAQGDVGLVREALYERGLLLRNAAHLVHNQTFIIPNYDVLNGPFYWVGLKLYDLLAGKLSLGRSEYVKKDAVLDRIPVLIKEGLRNGICYHDGQFDDARLALNIAQTVIEKGGVALNHFRVKALEKDQKGAVCGVTATDAEQGEEFVFRSKSVVNATGVFANSILEMDDEQKPPLIRPSQGAHIVLDRSFLQSEEAIMIPKTSDGRVLFAVPWHNRVILGTTDVPVKGVALEPKPMEDEIDYILETAGRYLARAPKRSDILSVYAGLRPLAAGNDTGLEKTKEISRSHKILVEESGLITITGGKWTTFRKMGEDTIDRVIKVAGLPTKKSSSKEIKIHGTTARSTAPDDSYLSVYGSDQSLIADLIRANADWAARLHSQLEFTEAEVVFAVRNEMARTIEDVLARRVRMLFLDANAAIECAPRVADILMKELGRDEKWREDELLRFYDVAKGYLISGMKSPIAH